MPRGNRQGTRRQRRQAGRGQTRRENRATPQLPSDAPLAFVIMPFGVVFDRVYEQLFVPLLTKAGYRVRRADTLLNQRAIMHEVIAGITEGDLIWADLTGGNANVFYELGIAHALRKRTVLVAQRRDDVPFDLRGYKNHVYRLEFATPPSLVDDMTGELEPFLVAARRDEVLFGSPFTDFSEPSPEAESSEEDSGGILDAMADFLSRNKEFTSALAEAVAISERFTEQQGALNERISAVPEGANPIEHTVAIANDVAALWEATADGLQRVLDDKIVPLTLVIERGVKAAVEMGRRGEHTEQSEATFASLRNMARVAGETAETQGNLAALVRQNLGWVGVLRRPGTKLASMYDRFAATFDRIGALAGLEGLDQQGSRRPPSTMTEPEP